MLEFLREKVSDRKLSRKEHSRSNRGLNRIEGYLIYENGKPRESQATRFRCHHLYLEREEAEDIRRNL